MQSNFVQTRDLRMQYLQAGTGEPVIFIHGFPETSYEWRHQLLALARAGYHAINTVFAYLPVVTDPITKTPHGADPWETFHGMQMSGPATVTAKSGQVRSGGVSYVTTNAKGTELAITVKVDAKAAPRVRVGRIK